MGGGEHAGDEARRVLGSIDVTFERERCEKEGGEGVLSTNREMSDDRENIMQETTMEIFRRFCTLTMARCEL